MESTHFFFYDKLTSELDDDLSDVLQELNRVSAKWNDIGIALRLKTNTLEGFKGPDPSVCLRLVVTEWLRKNYNEKKFGPPTWQWLVRVVGDPTAGANMAHARDIAGRHKAKGMSSRYSVSNCKKSITLVQKHGAWKLFSERLSEVWSYICDFCTPPKLGLTVKTA